MGRFGLAAAVLGAAALPDVATARKRCKRKRCKRKKCKPLKTLTCSESCPANCELCFQRGSDSLLCGDKSPAPDCTRPCLSDSDCLESGRPYCVTGAILRATNEPEAFGDCPPSDAGFCASIDKCLA